ncbi:MAG: DNA repair protein RecO [Candidatus Solibacter usitatus]|nr:DNA repair protein RecO [Candidatus Solibacter usitatus]
MPARVSEAIVLQTYPFKESDLVVSFLARDAGKLRGIAKRARRPKSSFGSGLERLSQVKMSYFQRETRELVNLDSCDLIRSQFALAGDYEASVALDYFAEISEQLLPPAEPNERHFRLLLAVLEHLRSNAPGRVWLSVAYFSYWAVQLAGILPELDACLGCGTWLANPEEPQQSFYSRFRSGLFCSQCRRTAGLGKTEELTITSRNIAAQMQHTPVAQLSPEGWEQKTAADLRRFLVRQIEQHIERKLITASALEAA